MFSSSLLLLNIGKLDLLPPNSPLPEFIGAATSRISHGALVRQPDLIAASRESDGGAAQGLIFIPWNFRSLELSLSEHY